MAKIRIFYGSSTGNTEHVAALIQEELGDQVEIVKNIADANPGELSSAEALILGVSTWGDGELQDDWDQFFPAMDQVDLKGKKVALFGLGDASGFSGEFVSAMGTLYGKVKQCGAEVVGSWPSEDYDFQHSQAVVEGRFVGLALDEDNQPEKTADRVKQWLETIRPAFA